MEADDIDPAIAAAMGFSGFGAQPGGGKRRKFDTGSYVDPSIKPPRDLGTGANHTVVGDRTGARGGAGARDAVEQRHVPSSVGQTARLEKPDSAAAVGSDDDAAALQALRNGVRNEKGDMVYFLPSFIEDPWKDLRPS